MPRPLCLCLEELTPRAEVPRLTRCVALAGRQPGLRLSGEGALSWQEEVAGGLELWVSLDERLILYRPAGGPEAGVHRGGRSLAVPEEKPVVLVDGDELMVGERRLRVHVHGAVDAALPPEPLPEPSGGRLARAAAAALAIGAAVGSADCARKPIEVRPAVPSVMPQPAPRPAVRPDARPPQPPIEVRDNPPGAPATITEPPRPPKPVAPKK